MSHCRSYNLLTGVNEHLSSPQPVQLKESGLTNICRNSISFFGFVFWFGSVWFGLVDLMILTEMGNGVAMVTPHEGTPTTSVRVEDMGIQKKLISILNWLLPCLSS